MKTHTYYSSTGRTRKIKRRRRKQKKKKRSKILEMRPAMIESRFEAIIKGFVSFL